MMRRDAASERRLSFDRSVLLGEDDGELGLSELQLRVDLPALNDITRILQFGPLS
ncbi:hypothetical protein [Mesorhizobium sp.]|uniref:hypothetical protein n=1 Tax=Mesorhizobium sp. TaxID=1871066 RepID=UPI0025B87E7A|nr:hypothetical protein [Mesorhizobium sp.]